MYDSGAFDGVSDGDLKRPKVKVDDDLMRVPEARPAAEGSGDASEEREADGVGRRIAYQALLVFFVMALFAVTPEYRVNNFTTTASRIQRDSSTDSGGGEDGAARIMPAVGRRPRDK